MHGRIRLLVLGIMPALFLLTGCDNRQWLNDEEEFLSKAASEQLNTQNHYLLEDHDIDYRLVIQAAEGDINQRARRHFQDSGAGQRSQTGRGLLLLLDPQQNEVRLEVSTALEGVYTDAFVSYLERQQMVPFFRHNRVADGIAATTELIIERARQAKAKQAFQTPTQSAFSAGGGASVPAQIGEAAPKTAGGHDNVSRRYNTTWQRWLPTTTGQTCPFTLTTPAICWLTGSSHQHRWTILPAATSNVARRRPCSAPAAAARWPSSVIPSSNGNVPPGYCASRSSNGVWIWHRNRA